jgi:hypothetical protein
MPAHKAGIAHLGCIWTRRGVGHNVLCSYPEGPMKRRFCLLVMVFIAACGDKVPESKAAKDVGNIPKQSIDRATTGVDSAIQQGADRIREEEKKQ